MKAALPYVVSRVRECRFRLYRPVFDGFRRALSYNGCRSTGANRSIRGKNKAGVAARPLQVEIRIARVIGLVPARGPLLSTRILLGGAALMQALQRFHRVVQPPRGELAVGVLPKVPQPSGPLPHRASQGVSKVVANTHLACLSRECGTILLLADSVEADTGKRT